MGFRFWFFCILLHAASLLFGSDLHLPAHDPEFDEIEHYTGFSLKYNETHEQAEWVAYQLTEEETEGSHGRSNNFRPDTNISTGSASPADYRGSGFDRGHLAPAGDLKWSKQTMSESFLMSNISPQHPQLNREIWRKLEHRVREWARENDELYVVTGPVLTDGPFETIGPNEVAVPNYYFKVILDYRAPGIKAIGFVLPNGDTDFPLSVYAVTVDQVELLTGIDFYPALPDGEEGALEASLDLRLWDPDEVYEANSTSESLREPSAAVDEQEAALYWINANSGVRHNSNCRYWGTTKKGYFTSSENEGRACGICGG